VLNPLVPILDIFVKPLFDNDDHDDNNTAKEEEEEEDNDDKSCIPIKRNNCPTCGHLATHKVKEDITEEEEEEEEQEQEHRYRRDIISHG
jgi:hypothetical protein